MSQSAWNWRRHKNHRVINVGEASGCTEHGCHLTYVCLTDSKEFKSKVDFRHWDHDAVQDEAAHERTEAFAERWNALTPQERIALLNERV